MNIAIIGNGAIGNLLCWSSFRQHMQFINFVRSAPDVYIECTELDGQKVTIYVNQQTLNSVGNQELTQDVIFLPLKAYQIEPTVRQISQMVSQSSTLVLLHNGMIDLNAITAILPNNPIIAATTSYGAFKPNKHQLSITGLGATQAGWLDSSMKDSAVENIVNTLLPPCEWSDTILDILWRKLAINAVINPLTAIHNIKNGALCNSQYHPAVAAICSETAKVMNSLGLEVTADELSTKALNVASVTAANYSSMHQDIMFGRQHEIDNINGYICEQGSKLGIATPINQELVNKVKSLEEYFRD